MMLLRISEVILEFKSIKLNHKQSTHNFLKENWKILKITDKSRSKFIFHCKTFLRSTKFYFDFFVKTFAENQKWTYYKTLLTVYEHRMSRCVKKRKC